jgi:hypothetical protein
MKRFLAILSLLVFFSGCVTNQYTKEDFDNHKEPVSPVMSTIAGIVPGLPQLLHGEYMEAAIYGGGTLLLMGSSYLYFDPQTEEIKPGKELEFRIISTTGLALYTGGMVDGFVTGIKRTQQWRPIYNQFQKEVDNRRIKRLRQQYDPKTVNAILDGDMFEGMPRSALIESLGHPDNINTTVTDNTRHEQFVYEERGWYVYVENGEVTGWQY